MKVYEYEDYDDYVANQTKSNKRKIHWVYVQKRVVAAIARHKKAAKNIICHGTRNGAEQKFFEEYFSNAYIIGTEISDTATDFPMTVQHDFTMQKDEWVNKFDIVYSNAFDHTIKPFETLLTWKDQLSSTGRIYMEWSQQLSVCQASDPLLATNEEIVQLIESAGLKIVDRLAGKRKKDILFVCEKQ